MEEAPHIVHHIMNKEVFGSGDDALDYDAEDESSEFGTNYGLKYAFTLHNQKVQAKLLVEQILSISPFFARFSSTGGFKMNVIPLHYNEMTLSNLSGNEIIKPSDVIDFKYTRTKSSEVYTKVELYYDYDYGREKHDKKIE